MTKKQFPETVWIAGAVIDSFEERNKLIGDKFKNVFYCLGKHGKRMCILWGQTNANAGDEVEMKGRYNNDTFICHKLYIKTNQTK